MGEVAGKKEEEEKVNEEAKKKQRKRRRRKATKLCLRSAFETSIVADSSAARTEFVKGA